LNETPHRKPISAAGSESYFLSPTNLNHPQVLQDYLETLAEAAVAASPPGDKLLFGYAELKYRMAGGGKCAMCRAHVRHVVPVLAKRNTGEAMAYECLCQRCLLGEIALADEVEMRIGDASVRYTRDASKAEPVTRTFVAPVTVKTASGSN
jgi:hypothetical protein